MDDWCELLDGCTFMRDEVKSLPRTAELYLEHFCLGNHRGCARRMVLHALGPEAVPPDLHPTQTARAREIVSNG